MNSESMKIDEVNINAFQQSAPSTTMEHFVASTRVASEEELLKIIHKCLEAPGVFVFGELLDLSGIKNVC